MLKVPPADYYYIIIINAIITVTLNIKILQGHFTKIAVYSTMSVYEASNKVVFSTRRNDRSVVLAVTDDGGAFEARAAVIGKARSPSVER